MSLLGIHLLKKLSLGFAVSTLGTFIAVGGAKLAGLFSMSQLTPTDTELPNREKLSIQVDKLFENVPIGETRIYSFDDVSLALRDYKLQKNDLLVSPEQDGIYYLARFLDNKRGFQLEDGQEVVVFPRSFKGRGYKNIKLDWRTSAGSPIYRVTLGTCRFKVTNPKEKEKQLTITCTQFQGVYAKNGEKVTVTIGERDFRNFVAS